MMFKVHPACIKPKHGFLGALKSRLKKRGLKKHPHTSYFLCKTSVRPPWQVKFTSHVNKTSFRVKKDVGKMRFASTITFGQEIRKSFSLSEKKNKKEIAYTMSVMKTNFQMQKWPHARK